jgi:hypothetical protein
VEEELPGAPGALGVIVGSDPQSLHMAKQKKKRTLAQEIAKGTEEEVHVVL